MKSILYNDLIAAIQFADLATLKNLKALDPDRDQRDILHYAAKIGNPQVVLEILDSKWISEINNFDDFSFTPLMWATRNKNAETAKKLLEAGADVNAHDFSRIGNTALLEVIEFVNLELVKLLLSYGADPFICGWMGVNALDKAKDQYAKHSSVEAGEIILMLENVKKSQTNDQSMGSELSD